MCLIPKWFQVSVCTLAVAAGLVSLPAFAAPAAAAGASPAPSPAPAVSPPYVVEADGLRVELDLRSLVPGRRADELREEDPVAVQLHILDAATSRPVPGLNPAGWLDRLPARSEDGTDACKSKVENFLGGSILHPPDVDLNVFYVLALNSDATITVVDPLFSFGGSKLLALVELSAPGEDWVLSGDGDRLFVSLPKVGRVAVVDTASWKVRTEIAVGGLPSRLALQADGRYLWVGDSQAGPPSGVVVVDTASLGVVARIPTGPGYHEIELGPGDRHAFVSNRGGATVSLIDVASLAKVRDLEVGSHPVSLDLSPAAGALYVSSADGTVTVLDAERPQDLTRTGVLARMTAEPGLGQLRIAPGGRLGFVVNPEHDVVHIFDTSRNRIVQTADVEDGPDHVVFSDSMAYVRHLRDATVLMIPLAEVGTEGRPVPVIDFPGGQRPYAEGAFPSPAAGIVQAPGESSMLVANPADEMIYFYKEGMAAPMGSFRNYSREPRAVLVLDRSLAERGNGRYETAAKLPRAGTYDLAFFLDSPRVIHCFRFTVDEDPARARERRIAAGPRVEYLDAPTRVAVGEAVELRFRLLDPEAGAILPEVRDLEALTFLVPGIWQQRDHARAVGDGVFAIQVVPREAGTYRVQLAARSLGLTFDRSAGIAFQAVAIPEPSTAR